MSSSSESDDDLSQDHQFETEVVSANSTQIVNTNDLYEVKLALIDKIKELFDTSQSHSYRQSIKKIDWNLIEIPGYSKETLQQLLKDVVKSTGFIRTLDEIFVHYVNNQAKIELRSHPGKPVKPKPAHVMWYEDNKSKIEQKLAKENPDEKLNFFKLLKIVAGKFEVLPDKKKQFYLDKFENEKALYDEKLKNFMSTNKVLISKANLKVKSKKEKPMKVLTPMGLYRQEVGGNASFKDIQESWKILPKTDKINFIKCVLEDKSGVEKKVTKEEMKILKEIDGPPKKPAAYTIFYNKFRQTYTGDKLELGRKCGEAWKNVSKREKAAILKQHDKAMVQYRLQLQKFINSLPLAQQMTWKIKYKKDLNETVVKQEKPEKMSFKTEVTSSVSENGSPSKKRPRNVLSDDDEVEKSPKKSPSKKAKYTLPEYPSQTTAHFYMMNVYNGKQKKVRKSYNKLSAEEKKSLHKQMQEKRHEYVKELSKCTGKMSPKEIEEYKANVAKFKADQSSQIEWHESQGTDDETHNSSSSEEETDSD